MAAIRYSAFWPSGVLETFTGCFTVVSSPLFGKVFKTKQAFDVPRLSASENSKMGFATVIDVTGCAVR